jgi:glycosyltransferase involved in cell wall biosynthesis
VKSINGNELVSVLIPAYNCMESIHFALDSLLSQSWINIEIIVADDASSDSTPDIVAKYIKRDPRVRYVRLDKNQGAYMARNTALSLAKGDYITTHDTDDWSHPQKIELQVMPLIADTKLSCTCSSWARMDENFFLLGKMKTKSGLYMKIRLHICIGANKLHVWAAGTPFAFLAIVS